MNVKELLEAQKYEYKMTEGHTILFDLELIDYNIENQENENNLEGVAKYIISSEEFANTEEVSVDWEIFDEKLSLEIYKDFVEKYFDIDYYRETIAKEVADDDDSFEDYK